MTDILDSNNVLSANAYAAFERARARDGRPLITALKDFYRSLPPASQYSVSAMSAAFIKQFRDELTSQVCMELRVSDAECIALAVVVARQP